MNIIKGGISKWTSFLCAQIVMDSEGYRIPNGNKTTFFVRSSREERGSKRGVGSERAADKDWVSPLSVTDNLCTVANLC